MTSRMLSRLCTLSPGNTSFITVSFPSYTAQTALLLQPCPRSVPLLSPALSPHRLGQEQLQLAILQHVDAGVGLTGSEDVIPLLTLLENHVLAELQEQRLLKVSQHPVRMGTAGDTKPDGHHIKKSLQHPISSAPGDAERRASSERP